MGRERKINLGKSDDKLKTWFKAADNKKISRIVCAAVEYYEITGEYLAIGTLNLVNIGLPNARKVIYVPENSEANRIFQSWENEKKTVSTIIKRILNMGIKIDYECTINHVIEEDEAITIVENLKRKTANLGRNEAIVNEKDESYDSSGPVQNAKPKLVSPLGKYEPETKMEENEDSTDISMLKEQIESRSQNTEKETSIDNKPQDLIASMLGKGCGLGNS